MSTKQLLKSTKVVQAITPANGVAGSTDLEGATIDMLGFEGIVGIVTFGVITGSAVTGIVWQQSNDSGMSGPTTLTAPAFTVADDSDGDVYVSDLFKPTMRYVRLHVDRATQNAVVASAEYIQYGARTEPVTSASATVNAASGVAGVAT